MILALKTGANGEGRTPMALRPLEPKSSASASSATFARASRVCQLHYSDTATFTDRDGLIKSGRSPFFHLFDAGDSFNRSFRSPFRTGAAGPENARRSRSLTARPAAAELCGFMPPNQRNSG